MQKHPAITSLPPYWMQCVSLKAWGKGLEKFVRKKVLTAHTAHIYYITADFLPTLANGRHQMSYMRDGAKASPWPTADTIVVQGALSDRDTGSTIFPITTSNIQPAFWFSINARDAQYHFFTEREKYEYLLSSTHLYRYWLLIKAITYYKITFRVLFVFFHNCSVIWTSLTICVSNKFHGGTKAVFIKCVILKHKKLVSIS